MPPLLLGATLAFWGWQSNALVIGLALAVLLEAARYVRFRLELRAVDERRIADFSTVLFAAVLALLVGTRGVTDGVLTTVAWLPALFALLVAAQLYSSRGRVHITSLFYSLRRQKARNPSMHDPLVDVASAYLAITAVAAGVRQDGAATYYAGVVVLVAWAILALRPRHTPLAASVAMLVAAAGIGYAAHQGLSRLQNELEDWASEFFVRAPNDPYRTRTAIGTLGRLKQTDAILLRVYAPDAQAARLKLLHTASFNTYAGGAWNTRDAALTPLAAAADGTTWLLSDAVPGGSAPLVIRAEPGRTLLALPMGTARISGLVAASVKRNSLGSMVAELPPGWARYEAGYGEHALDEGSPAASDLTVPAEEAAALEQVADQLGLRNVDAEEAVRRVRTHLGGFRYSLWRERAADGQSAIGDFLLRTHAGHCEYFATAAALLLRTAGIPARYATGFAAIEHSRLENAFVVRARHAHAWTRMYVAGRWTDLDTTPPSWAEEEEASLAPLWQGPMDLLRWASLRWALRDAGGTALWWWGAAALGVLLLAWRLRRQGRLVKARNAGARAFQARRGMDSELYAVEAILARRFGPRAAAESFSAWLARLGNAVDASLGEKLASVVALHQRHRFDPAGLSEREREVLRRDSSAAAEMAAKNIGHRTVHEHEAQGLQVRVRAGPD